MSAAQLAEAHGVLAAKIRSQAVELTRTLEALQAARGFGALVERRLLQAAPEHALPVTEAALATPFPWPTLRAPRDDGGEARRAAEAAVRRGAASPPPPRARPRPQTSIKCAHALCYASSVPPPPLPPRSLPTRAPS